jgi:hypothetical protein
MDRVLVDTNVLFPFSVMDLMLALTEDAAGGNGGGYVVVGGVWVLPPRGPRSL